MHPLNYLRTFGPRVDSITSLTWGLMIISIVVTIIITALVMIAIGRAPRNSIASAGPVKAGASGLRWISIGVTISTIVLVGAVGWTVAVVAAVSKPPRAPAFTIDVTGRQWWWEVRYNSADPGRVFTTANEIHIPVGEAVLIRLHGGDVIHSFWVPGLAGKTDTIPGQTNVTWLQANEVGRYRGQCTEFCGLQHAHMGLEVVADTADGFAAWWNMQTEPTSLPANGPLVAGEQTFTYRCGACHTVRGTEAHGTVAPDLTHLMSRKTIAATTLPNTPAGLSAWISDPQGIKPGTLMPDLGLSGRERDDIRSFLLTLK